MHKQITTYISNHKQQILGFLEELVCIQSGSNNKTGVDNVVRRIRVEMESMGFSCETDQQGKLGNHLIARTSPDSSDESQILITGHMDTVFPENTDFNFFKTDETHCYGPGVADMKGGLVVGIFAIKALVQNNLMPKRPICFIFNSDEEIGSPSSTGLIIREAEKSGAAFVLEAGGLSDEIVTGRKGNISCRIEIEGEAGHAAFAGRNKASAILELAHKTIAIEQLNAPEKGISANVGTIKGGLGHNTIAQHAHARIDFRFLNDNDARMLKAAAEKISSNNTIPGTRSAMSIISGRPAMPQNEGNMKLFGRINDIANAISIPVVSELRQGVSDANTIAKTGTPVIDGLGPIGAKDHSADEYIETESLFSRTILFANILASL